MSYGISSLSNDYGEVVIDPGFRNYQVVKTGTMPSGGKIYFNLPSPPLFFLRMPIGGAFIRPRPVTRTSAEAVGSAGMPYLLAHPSTTNNDGGGYGIAIRDGSGRLVYSSNNRYIDVQDALNFSVPTGAGNYPRNVYHASLGSAYYVNVGILGISTAFCGMAYEIAIQRAATNRLRMENRPVGTSYTGGGWAGTAYGSAILARIL